MAGKTLAVLGLTAFFLGAAPNKLYTVADGLESLVLQEAVAKQEAAPAQVDQQKYDEIKKMFEEADSVGFGAVVKVGFDYNEFYKNICTKFYIKGPNGAKLYKFKNQVLTNPNIDGDKKFILDDNGNKTYGPKKFINPDNNEPLDLIVTYKAVKPGTAIPDDVKKAAEMASLTNPVYDENTPDLKENDEVIVFFKSIPVRSLEGRKGMLNYLKATPENMQAVDKIFREYIK
jgi:hypothetical protein